MMSSVTDRELVSLLTSALHDVPGEAAAIGAADGDQIEFVCRGSLADAPVHTRTVFYGASVINQIVGLAAAHGRPSAT